MGSKVLISFVFSDSLHLAALKLRSTNDGIVLGFRIGKNSDSDR